MYELRAGEGIGWKVGKLKMSGASGGLLQLYARAGAREGHDRCDKSGNGASMAEED